MFLFVLFYVSFCVILGVRPSDSVVFGPIQDISHACDAVLNCVRAASRVQCCTMCVMLF